VAKRLISGSKPMFCSGIAIAISVVQTHQSVADSLPLKRRKTMEKKFEAEHEETETCNEEPRILEEIQVEELAIDGICGVY